ncbi:ImmA/IrrE family metallo-endopeptidase [Rhizobium sp. CB3090]|uniref:ImmA/IrrE family metallo-endopeptidase n=1 Tax=Rhizobium sp. CB3090 TaxID=3039156 RepID=UPI0024B06C76|nr:ImmA/IrrE family metallo-endopeptidase [Rhizobium sp. CB3090]WFU10351.1 ImmA/IrrE family metallo-endopeptidase [Rhizobium sp. CB3090]
MKRQENFDEAVTRAVERIRKNEDDDLVLSIPAPGSKPRGKMTDEKKAAEIRRRLVYFNVPTVGTWESRYGRLIGNTDFRTSNTYSSTDEDTLLWLRRGELESDMINTRPWNPGNLEDRLEAIRKLSRVRHPQSFLPKLRTLCAEAGVALVIVRPPTGCKASGAARMVDPDKAMILLSFRYRSDDQFWFTVFHEIGHLVLHKANTFLDGDETPFNDKEQEANEFAESCIIPGLRASEFERLTPDKDSVIRFSVSIGIAPGLTVGQMQHRDMIPKSKLNYLKRRWKWEEIDPALP